MKFNKTFLIASVILLAWLVLSWFLGTWLGLHSPVLWILRIGLAVLGIAGFIGYLMLRPKEQDGPVSEAASNAAAEIDNNFTEAQKRIQAATGIKQLNSLPAIFVLGDSGAAKTTILAQSGIEPELIAGQAMQANMVIPTPSVNLWYSRNTLFIDPSGSVVADPGARRKLFRKFVPVQLNSVLASKTPPTRSVLLAVDCEMFLLPDGPNVVAAKAREYQTVLTELSRELGSSFPVYVLFTKADRITYFREFVENLNQTEIAEMLGVSLPMPPSGVQGSYAERQAARLNNAFQTIYYSLTDKRPLYLARERSAANLSNIYEFPREFGKLRSLLVQFLTDLCRPSQLGTSPFLRGFYFTGVRPVVINEVVPAMQVTPDDDAGFDAGATRMFNRQQRSAPLVPSQQSGSRKIPQWVFLRSLVPGILLADRVGTSAAQVNVKVNFVRRVMWATAAAVALAMTVWWTVSYRNNSQLADDALSAANAVPTLPLASGQLATADSLQKLSKVRQTLERLNDYELHGKPWSYRALLYKGSEIREPLSITYWAQFRKLLLSPTQQTLIEITTNPGDDKAFSHYDYVYKALKAYLITTQYPKKTWTDFVGVLMQHWKKDQPVSAAQETEAAANFNFYADQLPDNNLYPRFAVPNAQALRNARGFLNGFDLEEGIYRALLDSAAGKLRPLVFNKDYAGTEDTVRNKYLVEPWFRKEAYASFQSKLKDNDNLTGEPWVLEPPASQNIDYNKIRANLKIRYDNDYIKTWREFLEATSEAVPYANYSRAHAVLAQFAKAESPLLKLFCVASQNTDVGSANIGDAFQPVHVVAPKGCISEPIGQDVAGYVGGLAALANALQSIGPESNPNLSALDSASLAATSAANAADTLTLKFHLDPTDPNPKETVKSTSDRLLKDPITPVSKTIDAAKKGPVNGKAAETCAAVNPLFRKYPFSPKSPQEATQQELNDLLAPQTGRLWMFINSDLMKPFLQEAGGRYVANISSNGSVTNSFRDFVNRAAAVRQAFYGTAGATPNMQFTMHALQSGDVDHVQLTVDGNTLAGDPKTRPSQTFTWPGTSPGVSLSMGYGNGEDSFPSTSGTWAIWRFLDTAERGSWPNPEWIYRTTAGPIMHNGHPIAVKFSVDGPNAQVLSPGFLSGLVCPSPAIQ